MARRLKSRELIERELESLRGPTAESPAPSAPSRPAAAPAARTPGMRPTTVLLFIAVLFGLCIVIFFMGVQNNDLQGQVDGLQDQLGGLQDQLGQYQQMQVLNITAQEAIAAAHADPWVSQNIGYVEQQTAKYGYEMRAFAVLTQRPQGPFWNVVFVGLDCDCQPPQFNSILALVDAQTGEVPQAFQGLHMNETAFKDSVWSNLTIAFWP